MNQTPTLVGHLEWLLTQKKLVSSPRPLSFYNCAIRIRLDALDAASWSHPKGDTVRKKLLSLTDSLANAALSAYLKLRKPTKAQAELDAMEKCGRAVVAFARKSGFAGVASEKPGASEPPDVADVVSVLTGLSPQADDTSALPKKYQQGIVDGLLDVFAGAAHLRDADEHTRGVGRTMVNTGAAAIILAQQTHVSPTIQRALSRHNNLAAKVLRKPS